MCSNYRMSAPLTTTTAVAPVVPVTQNNSGGLFSAITGLFGKKNSSNSTAKNNKNVSNNTSKNNKNVMHPVMHPVMPVTRPFNAPVKGGMASVNYRVANMQPSEKIMEWATTAGAPTPSTGMRNISHGGRRTRHSKKSRRKHHTLKRKTNKSNRRNRRNKSNKKNKRHSKRRN